MRAVRHGCTHTHALKEGTESAHIIIQYLPSKPDKYRIKIFWAADAENNFPFVAEPYLGRPLGADRQVNFGRNVALRLSAPFFNSGRNATTDNFFTDKELSVRANKRFLPESFKNKRGLQLHASSFLFQDKTTIVNYQTKRNKNVVVMSTMHRDCAVAPQAPKKNPDILRFYNLTKGAVDSVDQMAPAYSTKRITRWWPMVLFYNTLDLSTIAARIVWSIKFPDHLLSKKDARPQFILRVAEQLSLEHMDRRLCAQNMPKLLKITVEMHVQHLQQKAATSLDERQIARAGGKRKRPASAQRPSTSKQIGQKKPNQNQGHCGSCSRKLDRKYCFSCCSWVCKEHTMIVCKQCADSILSVECITVVNKWDASYLVVF